MQTNDFTSLITLNYQKYRTGGQIGGSQRSGMGSCYQGAEYRQTRDDRRVLYRRKSSVSRCWWRGFYESTHGKKLCLLFLHAHTTVGIWMSSVDCSIISFLVLILQDNLILYYSYLRCYNPGELAGGHTGPPCIFGVGGSTSWESISSVQLLSRVWLFATPWIAAHQVSLSISNSQSSLKLTFIESVVPSSHLILCCPLLLLPTIPPSVSLFQWANSSHEVAKVLEFQLWHHSFQRNPRADLLQNGLVGSPCSPRDSQESSSTPLFPNKKLKKKLVRYCMRGEKVSTPLTRMEEALGPDNTPMVKALPPASWHLTTAFVENRLVGAVRESSEGYELREQHCHIYIHYQCEIAS